MFVIWMVAEYICYHYDYETINMIGMVFDMFSALNEYIVGVPPIYASIGELASTASPLLLQSFPEFAY